jgi:hypothetical protein
MADGNCLVPDFQDADKGLLLAEASQGEQGEFFLGELPGSFRAGDRDGNVLFRLGRKKTVFLAIVPGEEKVHESQAFYHVSLGRGKQGARLPITPIETRFS